MLGDDPIEREEQDSTSGRISTYHASFFIEDCAIACWEVVMCGRGARRTFNRWHDSAFRVEGNREWAKYCDKSVGKQSGGE